MHHPIFMFVLKNFLDKTTSTKTIISERSNASFFDSNFYPQLIRFLPLKNGYEAEISIFDYNPKAKIGLLKATIKGVEEVEIDFDGQLRKVWKVVTTDDISNNMATITYYIDKFSRKFLKQDLQIGERKMVMRLIEE